MTPSYYRFDERFHEADVKRIKSTEQELLTALQMAGQAALVSATNALEPQHRAALSPDRVRFALVLTTDFNANVQSSRQGVEIFVNFGLAKFYSEFTRTVFSQFGVLSESQHKRGETAAVQCPSDRARAWTRVLLEAFWTRMVPTPEADPRIQLSGANAGLHRRFLLSGLRFVVAHEFGHVLQTVSEKYRSYRAAGEDLVGRVLQDAKGTIPRELRDHLASEWGGEFAADIIGLELSLSDETDSMERWWQVYSNEWFFLMCEFLLRYRVKTHGNAEGSSSHPPAFMRLDVIRNHTRASTRRIDMIDALRQVLSQIMEDLFPEELKDQKA